jgi:beta-xylosidase
MVLSRIFPFVAIVVGCTWIASTGPSCPQPDQSHSEGSAVSKPGVWVPDNGDGTYSNPVLHADYSDPDAIRVGDDFYLTASSFNSAPGLPILHSKDLVNWRIIGHALQAVPPADSFWVPQHGKGVWAPAIRFHNGGFWIYYGDPDHGIYLVKAKRPEGPWDPPVLVRKARGWIDPCPFWDSDGSAYIVHAWAKSRAGFNSILTINRMNSEGTAILDEGVAVFDGRRNQPTIEGPKLYFRDGYYYIFAPVGGVKPGWQTVLRAKDIYGPYEARIVMDQGKTAVNGPHQGAWAELASGESWFLHFQKKDPYGRIVHLQPLRWEREWPVIGSDPDGDGKGEPVLRHRKPAAGGKVSIQIPQTSDEFDNGPPGLQWQWSANPSAEWIRPTVKKGVLRMTAIPLPPGSRNLRDAPNLLLQKLCAPRFSALVHLTAVFSDGNAEGGLVVMGMEYAALTLKRRGESCVLSQVVCPEADKKGKEIENGTVELPTSEVILRVDVTDSARCSFSWSTDGRTYTFIGRPFAAMPEAWTGAKVGLFCTMPSGRQETGNDFIDVDWFRIESLK